MSTDSPISLVSPSSLHAEKTSAISWSLGDFSGSGGPRGRFATKRSFWIALVLRLVALSVSCLDRMSKRDLKSAIFQGLESPGGALPPFPLHAPLSHRYPGAPSHRFDCSSPPTYLVVAFELKHGCHCSCRCRRSKRPRSRVFGPKALAKLGFLLLRED